MTEDEADRCGPPTFVFRSPYLREIRFEGRPISVEPPPSAAVGLMYRRNGNHVVREGIGAFKDGRWTNGRGKPLQGDLYWTAMVDERGE